jgi:CheY-like chemotaxis protein
MNNTAIPDFIVVDDDYINNFLCQEYILLVAPAANVITFTHPRECIAYIRGKYIPGAQIDTIVFLDINMPVINGWEVLEEFNNFPDELQQHLKIYILTSSVAEEDKELAINNPLVSGFYEKPLSIPILKSIVSALGAIE